MTHETRGGVLRPRDAADVAAVVADARRPLEPVAGGTKRAVGRPVEADLLDLAGLAGIVTYEPAELVLTAHAATPLATLEAALAAHGQRLAFEPPDFGALLGASSAQTIGGILGANLSGSRRVAGGAARDHFLGFAGVSGRGERFKAGGKVVKNVTGYDLPKLMAGSWGTLAIFTEVTLRVVPAPELDRTLVVPGATPAASVALLCAALGSPHDVSAAGFDPARGSLLRLEGFAASVEARTAALCADLRCQPAEVVDGAASRRLWRAHASAEALAASPVVWRISVPPTDAPAVLERLRPDRYLLDWGGGLIHAAYGGVDAARVRGAFTAGHATLLKAGAAERAATAVFQPQPAVAAAAAARLKAAFDPRGILNPGRMG
ncbi:MAG TPA: FAD-binding protein [Gammaproteobacteria bacterium]|nr:FAD-binding protein [Gammaproteobacteria bacterium]